MTNENASTLIEGDMVSFRHETIQTRHVLKTRVGKNGNVEILIQGDSQNGYADRWYPASDIE